MQKREINVENEKKNTRKTVEKWKEWNRFKETGKIKRKVNENEQKNVWNLEIVSVCSHNMNFPLNRQRVASKKAKVNIEYVINATDPIQWMHFIEIIWSRSHKIICFESEYIKTLSLTVSIACLKNRFFFLIEIEYN